MHYEATFSQYLFCLILYLVTLYVTWSNRNSRKTSILALILILINCLFSFASSDYFRYEEAMQGKEDDFHEPLYYYIILLVNRNFIIFRTIVWGGSLLLYYLTIKKLSLNVNTALFIFTCFFLTTFSYARASLAMASYFYGITLLLSKKSQHNIMSRWIIGAFFVVFSFLAHRSFLPIIMITPLMLIVKIKKIHIALILLSLPFLVQGAIYLLNAVASDELTIEGDSFEQFSLSARQYATYGTQKFNWRYTLMNDLKYYGFYLPILLILWKTVFSNKRVNIKIFPMFFSRFLSVTVFIMLVALVFFITPDATDVLGYRFLYMAGIPITILLTYLYQKRIITITQVSISVSLVLISSVGFFVGKLFTT